MPAVGQVNIAEQADSVPQQRRPASKLEYTKWSGDLNVTDPVSISFDAQGRAYVNQTARRKIQEELGRGRRVGEEEMGQPPRPSVL